MLTMANQEMTIPKDARGVIACPKEQSVNLQVDGGLVIYCPEMVKFGQQGLPPKCVVADCPFFGKFKRE